MSRDDVEMFKAGLLFGFMMALVERATTVVNILKAERDKDGRKPKVRILRSPSRG